MIKKAVNLTNSTAVAISGLTKTAAMATKDLLSPQPGERKMRIVLLMSLPFLLVSFFALFWYGVPYEIWGPIVSDFIKWMVALATAGITVEKVADTIKKKPTEEDDSKGA